MTNGLVGVTGSSGHLGGAVARELAGHGIPMRLVCRDAGRAPRLPGAQVAVAAYGDSSEAVNALRGVSTLLMVSATESAARLAEHLGFLDAAAQAKVQHVVYTSFYRAAPDAAFTLAREHWATEEHLRGSGMAHTILRDNLYLDVLRYFVVDGVMRGRRARVGCRPWPERMSPASPRSCCATRRRTRGLATTSPARRRSP